MKANREPIVSIVMPVYNGEEYLREAVESILNQTFSDFEFIIIDDGSIDATPEILAAYAVQDTRIVLHRHPENLGLIKTLNKGVAMARGELIARHDADDISLPERLATQVAFFRDHPEVGLLGTAYYRLYSNGDCKLCQPPVTDTGVRWKLLFDNIWCHASMMFTRNLIARGELFYRDFPHIEDYELWTRLIKHTRAATLKEPLVIYRVHDNSVCATHHEEQIHKIALISVQQLGEFFPEHPLGLAQLEALRQCYRGQKLTNQDIVQGGLLVLRLFNLFEQQPNIDKDVLRIYQWRWIKSLLAEVTIAQWPALWMSGLLPTILFHNPLALFTAITTHLPRRVMRQIKLQAT